MKDQCPKMLFLEMRYFFSLPIRYIMRHVGLTLKWLKELVMSYVGELSSICMLLIIF